jgi:Ras-related protein Rab-7A
MPSSLQKIIILGNSGVGKTSLMERYVAAKFSAAYKTTIGADFSTKDVQVGKDLITLQIWDTAGQERFQSLGVTFYRGADACVLVYDVTDLASFKKLDSWRDEFLRAADVKEANDFPFIVLGNKSDLDVSKHTVTNEMVSTWCASKGNIPFFAVSAKSGDGVDEAFLALVTAAAKKVKEAEEVPIIPDTLKLNDVSTKPRNRGGNCC